MGHAENRRIGERLRKHQRRMLELMEEGMGREKASRVAYEEIVNPKKQVTSRT